MMYYSRAVPLLSYEMLLRLKLFHQFTTEAWHFKFVLSPEWKLRASFIIYKYQVSSNMILVFTITQYIPINWAVINKCIIYPFSVLSIISLKPCQKLNLQFSWNCRVWSKNLARTFYQRMEASYIAKYVTKI